MLKMPLVYFFLNYFFVFWTWNNSLTFRRKLCIHNTTFMSVQSLNQFTRGCKPKFNLYFIKKTINYISNFINTLLFLFFLRNYFFVNWTWNNFLTIWRELCIPNPASMSSYSWNQLTCSCRPNFHLFNK